MIGNLEGLRVPFQLAFFQLILRSIGIDTFSHQVSIFSLPEDDTHKFFFLEKYVFCRFKNVFWWQIYFQLYGILTDFDVKYC